MTTAQTLAAKPGQRRGNGYTIRYSLAGAAFGVCFPVLATIIVLIGRDLPASIDSIIRAQRSEPLLWIIDTAPFFLGVFASFAGRREDRLQQSKLQLEELITSLESRVAEHTRDLNRAVEVGHQVARIRHQGQLLTEAVELIRSSFGLYHVQVFLLDRASRNLVLQASTGPTGSDLLLRDRRLPVAPGSTIGTAAIEKRAVIVADTAHSPLFRPTPFLPDTRSEMSVPLMVGDNVIGVLDLHSDRAGTLTSISRPTYEAVAGQLAVALENTRLFLESSRAQAELEAQTRRLQRSGWQRYLNAIDRSEIIGYLYERGKVIPLDETTVTNATEQGLSRTISVADVEIGRIVVPARQGRAWSDYEAGLVERVAQRVAQQVENLRLLAEADRFRAEAEGATRRLTRAAWEAHSQTQGDQFDGFTYTRRRVQPVRGRQNGGASGGQTITRALTVRGEPIGQLEIVQGGVLDDEAGDLVAAVGNQLSAHLENLRLSEQTELALAETEQQARRLALLNQLGQELAAAVTLEDVYSAAVVGIRRIIRSDRSSIAILNASGDSYEILALDGEKGDSHVGDRAPIAGSSIATAVTENRVIYTRETENSGIPGIISFVVAPLIAGGRALGTINVGSKELNAYSNQDQSLLFQVASLLASNIESRRLFAQTETALADTEEQARRLALLNEMAEEISHSESEPEMFAVAGRYTYPIFSQADHVGIAILSSSGEHFDVFGMSEGEEAVTPKGTNIPTKDGMIGVVVAEDRLVNTPDITDSVLFDFRGLAQLGMRSVVTAPLTTGGEVKGTLNIGSRKPSAFRPRDEQLILQISALLASTMERRRLFEQVQARARRERILREVSARVRSGADVDTIMRTAVREIGQALGRRSFVYLDNRDPPSASGATRESSNDQ